MTNFSMASYEGEEMSYVLNARQADIRRKEDRVFVTQPQLKIYKKGARGRLLAVASGRKGHLTMDSKDITFEDNVEYRVVAKNWKLTTSKLIYWAGRHETEVPIGTGYTLTTSSGIVEGSGMISKEDLTK
ncbi:MAG: LPS export ABC transporter periplasmic protein LptC [Elusimicrobia bacterium]|nr:LPS export ABC transporter periplasmic protein LptC [Elusimicrobiota bacterium]